MNSNGLEILKYSLNYYDKNFEDNKLLLEKVNNIEIIDGKNDLDNNTIILYDKYKKLIHKGNVELIGIYYHTDNIWIWGWSIPNINKLYTKIIKTIFDYGLQLDPNNDNNIYIRSCLLTSRFRISNNIQLEMLLALSSYLSKISCIFGDYNKELGLTKYYYVL